MTIFAFTLTSAQQRRRFAGAPTDVRFGSGTDIPIGENRCPL